MFILRSKVKITDESESWEQFGVWDANVPNAGVSWSGNVGTIRVGDGRYLQIAPRGAVSEPTNADEAQWALQEIRAGRPLITSATQDQFVPQMVNFEQIGGVDFKKGCYPGQEIVARTQYRGILKRRMARAHLAGDARPLPGQNVYSAAFGDQSAFRKQNLACDSTVERTSCAPNAGGHVRSACMYAGSVLEISLVRSAL